MVMNCSFYHCCTHLTRSSSNSLVKRYKFLYNAVHSSFFLLKLKAEEEIEKRAWSVGKRKKKSYWNCKISWNEMKIPCRHEGSFCWRNLRNFLFEDFILGCACGWNAFEVVTTSTFAGFFLKVKLDLQKFKFQQFAKL